MSLKSVYDFGVFSLSLHALYLPKKSEKLAWKFHLIKTKMENKCNKQYSYLRAFQIKNYYFIKE